jgi:hypothetical protein
MLFDNAHGAQKIFGIFLILFAEFFRNLFIVLVFAAPRGGGVIVYQRSGVSVIKVNVKLRLFEGAPS